MANTLELTEFQVAILDQLANGESSHLLAIDPSHADTDEQLAAKARQKIDLNVLAQAELLLVVTEKFSDGLAKAKAENNGRGFEVYEITEHSLWMFNKHANRTIQ